MFSARTAQSGLALGNAMAHPTGPSASQPRRVSHIGSGPTTTPHRAAPHTRTPRTVMRHSITVAHRAAPYKTLLCSRPIQSRHVYPLGLRRYSAPCRPSRSSCHYLVNLRGLLAWRRYRRQKQPHGMLGDGQPPPCMEVHTTTRSARASRQSPPTR